MTNIDSVYSYLIRIYPRSASNHEIMIGTGIKPHQQIFRITSNLRARGLIVANQKNGEWLFQYKQINENADTESVLHTVIDKTKSASFEEIARNKFDLFFNKHLPKGSIPGINKEWDFLSDDRKIVGDAKFYTMVNGFGNPSAKLSTISEHVWLLEKTHCEKKFLVFGNQIEVPQNWLKKYGDLVSNIKFYFLLENGDIMELN